MTDGQVEEADGTDGPAEGRPTGEQTDRQRAGQQVTDGQVEGRPTGERPR